MRFLIAAGLGLLIAGCGKSEGEIRAEERARIAEERLAAIEAETPAPAAPTERATPAPAPAPTARDANGNSTVTAATRRIGSYVAYISRRDLYNTRGQRLDQPWQVLRQDRANFHRYNIRDAGDSSDGFFASPRNREIMERMLRRGSITPEARQRILAGGAAVRVEIHGTGDDGDHVTVTVF